MSDVPEQRCALRRVSRSEWVISDLRYPRDDSRHAVARLHESDDTEVEVVWLRDLPLATRYGSALAVLDDVERVLSVSRATRPVPIRHLPPPHA